MRLLIGFICLFLALPAWAETVANAEATAGNQMTLSDGRILQLAGITQPFAAGQWRAAAQKTLRDLIAGQQIIFDDAETGRYGHLSAQVYALDAAGKKIWLQEEMLKRGLAFVYPPTGFEARLDEMLAIEAKARQAKTGIWGDATYADVPADNASPQEGRFAFVSGTVMDAARVKNMVYLNFGADWRTDFTIAIAAHDLHNFRRANIDLLELKGKVVRVRGWIKEDHGPMITVTDPGQIEFLSQ